MLDFPERLIALQPFWGSWVLDGFIGEGSYGRVYRIRREEMKKVSYAALKWITLPKNRAELKEFRTEGLIENEVRQLYRESINRLRKEIDLMSQLKGNSHVVNYEDHLVIEREHEIGWDILIRMELLTPLSDRFQAGMTVGDVINLGLDLCDALSRCAKVHIIHRDIKTDNIFFSRFGDYKLGDFGVARSMEENATHMSKQGTPIYMAPEVYLGKRAYDSTVDIYSLGLVMHRLLNRQRLPFLPMDDVVPTHAQRDAALETRLRGTPIPPPVDGGIALAKVICKACAFEPKKRYHTAEEMHDALQKAAGRTDLHKALTSNPTGAGLRSGRSSLNPDVKENCDSINRNKKLMGQNNFPRRRHFTWPWMIVAATVFVIISIFGTKLWMERTKQPETTIADTAMQMTTPTSSAASVATATPGSVITTYKTDDSVITQTDTSPLMLTATPSPIPSIDILKECPYSAQAFMKMINDGNSLRDTYHYFYANTALGSIAAGGDGLTIGLTRDAGVVIDQGDRNYSDFAGWTDVIAVEASNWACYGLNSDGTVLYQKSDSEGLTQEVPFWSDIVAISASDCGVLASLHSDGTVTWTDLGDWAIANQVNYDVSSWTDIVAIDVGSVFIVGLRSDGTVLVAENTLGNMYIGNTNLKDWQNIVAVCASGQNDIIGLTSDGRVYKNGYSINNPIFNRNDIISISENELTNVILAVTIDGTVCTDNVFLDFDLNAVVSQLSDVIAVDAGSGSSGDWHAVVLRSNGEVTVIGKSGLDYKRVSSNWTSIKTTGTVLK